MERFVIRYTESKTDYFAVDANDEVEALDRFNDWLNRSNAVFESLDNSDVIDSDVEVSNYPLTYIKAANVLTDDYYQELMS